MRQNITCVSLILGILAILYGLVVVIKFVTDIFPVLSILLVPVYLYIYYCETKNILKRRAFASDIFDKGFQHVSMRRYIAKLAFTGIGFEIMFFGLINTSEVVAFIMVAIAMLIGGYRFLEIGEDIKLNGISHTYGD